MWKQLLLWPPTATSVIGLGVIFGAADYALSGSVAQAMFVAGVFKVLCPQDGTAADKVTQILAQLPTALKTAALLIAVGAIAAVLSACTPAQEAAANTKLIAFETKAAPVIARACAKFHDAEVNPVVQLAVAGGTTLADVETAGAAGPIIASIKSYGDQFCAAGPPAGDATTAAQQAAWLAGVAQQLLATAAAR